MAVPANHRNPDETRARILEAARDAFAEQGYDRASVSLVCARAGITKGGFYHHFESKQAVFLEMLEDWLQDMDARITAFEQQAPDVPTQLVAMTGVLGHVLDSAGPQLSIYLEYVTQAMRDPELRQITVEPYQRFHARIARLIERGVAEGSLNPVPADATASTILALAMGLLVGALLAPDAMDMSSAAAQAMRTLLASIVREE